MGQTEQITPRTKARLLRFADLNEEQNRTLTEKNKEYGRALVDAEDHGMDPPTPDSTAEEIYRHPVGTDVLRRGSHPFGIKPLGNVYDIGGPAVALRRRRESLGALAVLSDELLVEILGLLDNGQDMAQFMEASKYCYAYGGQEDLWRNLNFMNDGQTLGRFIYSPPNWRHTYIHRYTRHQLQKQNVSERKSVDEQEVIERCSYCRTGSQSLARATADDLCSRLLFTPWHYASLALSTNWRGGAYDKIPKVKGLSVEEFHSRYGQPNKPVVLQDAMDEWAIKESWAVDGSAIVSENNASKSWLETYAKEVLFEAEGAQIALADFLTYSRTCIEESPLYLFCKDFIKRAPKMAEGWEVPPYFRRDLFAVLGERRPDYRWLIVGPARSGSTFHKDPNATSAWNAVVKGRKLWVMFPPSVKAPPGVIPSEDGSNVSTPLSVLEWFDQYYPLCADLPPHEQPIECICEEGELMFIPHGWWHAVLNLDFSIALTQNYVDEHNLANVLHFLRHQKNAISGLGCGDLETQKRVDGIAEEFEQALRIHSSQTQEWLEGALRDLASRERVVLDHGSAEKAAVKRRKVDEGQGDSANDTIKSSAWEALTADAHNDSEEFSFGF
eukprot:Clim_evm10s18 gene=Clim_evmTU10s18